MTIYEQARAEAHAAKAINDRFRQPLDYAVMRVIIPRPNRIHGKACAVRVQKPNTPVAVDAVMRSTQASA